jgi:hypothetical protein
LRLNHGHPFHCCAHVSLLPQGSPTHPPSRLYSGFRSRHCL